MRCQPRIQQRQRRGLTREHSRKLAGELETTCLLELGDHRALAIVRGRRLVYESTGQLLLVKLLEHVLVVDEAEDDHLL